jgi:hypothetical protein
VQTCLPEQGDSGCFFVVYQRDDSEFEKIFTLMFMLAQSKHKKQKPCTCPRCNSLRGHIVKAVHESFGGSAKFDKD